MYIDLTASEIKRASETDIVELLKAEGETVKKEGSWYAWMDGTEKVSIKGNTWFHQYERKGGNAIDFVRRFMNKTFLEAVQSLLGNRTGQLVIEQKKKEAKPPFRMPPKELDETDMENYLTGVRGIYPNILHEFMAVGLIYSTYNKGYHNAVFIGTDRHGVARHAHLRGTAGNFKMNAESSDDKFAFHWNGSSNRVYLFESPIDMLSYICLHGGEHWKQDSYVSACGVSDMPLLQCLKEHPRITKVLLCLDNDEKGQEFDEIIAKRLIAKGYDCEILVPVCKDWNEDLVTEHVADEGEKEECNLSM